MEDVRIVTKERVVDVKRFVQRKLCKIVQTEEIVNVSVKLKRPNVANHAVSR